MYNNNINIYSISKKDLIIAVYNFEIIKIY